MLTFVTVGTFEFDLLVQTVLSEPVLLALQSKGYTDLVVQCGNSDFEFAAAVAQQDAVKIQRHGVEIELWKFKPSLEMDYRRADLIVGHAGARVNGLDGCAVKIYIFRRWNDPRCPATGQGFDCGAEPDPSAQPPSRIGLCPRRPRSP
jgi:hypothetical protein